MHYTQCTLILRGHLTLCVEVNYAINCHAMAQPVT